MAGVNDQPILDQRGSNVEASIPWTVSGTPQWKIHEQPVDLTIDPKLRCRTEHVGPVLHSVHRSGYIHGVTTDSLILHSIVLHVDNEPAACGSIVPFALPTSAASVQFKSGIFGRIYIVQWSGVSPHCNASWIDAINHNN